MLHEFGVTKMRCEHDTDTGNSRLLNRRKMVNTFDKIGWAHFELPMKKKSTYIVYLLYQFRLEHNQFRLELGTMSMML